MRLKINYRKQNSKKHKNLEAEQYATNNQEITEEIKEEIKETNDKLQHKHDGLKPMGCSSNSSKGRVYSNTILPQEKRNASDKQPNLTPKATTEIVTIKKTQS